MPKTERMRIMNFGYPEDSRLLNVIVASYQQRKVYINLERNSFANPEYNNMIENILIGKGIDLSRAAVLPWKEEPEYLKIRAKESE